MRSRSLIFILSVAICVSCARRPDSAAPNPAPETEKTDPALSRNESSVIPNEIYPSLLVSMRESQNDFYLEVDDPEGLANLINNRVDVIDGRLVLPSERVRMQPNCRAVSGARIDARSVQGVKMTARLIRTRNVEGDEKNVPQKSITLQINEVDIGFVCSKPAMALQTEDFMWADLQQAVKGLLRVLRQENEKEPATSLRSCRTSLVRSTRKFRTSSMAVVNDLNVIAAKSALAKNDLELEILKQKLWKRGKYLQQLCESFRRKWEPFRCPIRREGREAILESKTVLAVCDSVVLNF